MAATPQAVAVAVVLIMAATAATPAAGFVSTKTWRAVRRANRAGAPFVGLVVPNAYEMDPVLKSPSFKPSEDIPILDVQGRRFRFGTIGGQSVVMVMTGLSMLNAGLTTQLLLSLFRVKGIVHWGTAGNANEDLQIGDVTIPEHWAHLSLWNWQRYGDGPENELPLEAFGDYTREFGFFNFSDYTVGKGNPELSANTLNSIWYQPEEIFPVSGTPEQRQHAFWVPVSKRYYDLAGKLEGLELPACVNATTCLPRAPKVTRVPRGCSANMCTPTTPATGSSSGPTSGAPPWRWRAPPWRWWRTSWAFPSSPSARSPTSPAAAPRSATRPPRSSPSPRGTPSTSCSSSCPSSGPPTRPRTCKAMHAYCICSSHARAGWFTGLIT